MVFLNPAVLFGLIAAAIPVVLHFLNLQKLNRIEFSTLAFLKELQKTKIRKLKFKQWLLLFLRILLILLLVSAFARPTLETYTIGGTSAAKTSSVFIVDDSFSMSLVKGSGSQFNKAKEIIKDILSSYEQGDEALILFTTDSQEKKFITDFQKLNEKIGTKKISVKKVVFSEVVNKAIASLNGSQNFNKELFIFSDFFSNNFGDEFETIENELGENTKVYLFNFGDEEFSNRIVSNFELSNQLLELDKTISFTAQIKNTNGSAVSNGVSSLFLNEKRSAQNSFNVEPDETKTITFESVLKESGLVKAFVEIESDDITIDNIRHTAFYVPEEINVLLVTQSENDSRFVKIALESASTSTSINVDQVNFQRLSSNLVNENDVVVFIGVSSSLANSIKDYLSNERKIIIMPGSETKVDEFESFFNQLGINTNVQRIGEANSTESISYFGSVEYEHPIFKNLFEEREETKVESPEIYSYFKIEAVPSLKPVINLRDNSLFLSEYSDGNASLLIFGIPPVLSWSNFPVKSLFAPLINKSILYQTMQTELGQQIIAGEAVDIRLTNLKLPQIKVVRPDETEEYLNISEIENRNYLSYSKTDELGVYEFYSGEELIDFASVNFDPSETNTDIIKEDELEEYLSKITNKNNIIYIDPSDDYQEEIKQARFGTELWKYFLIAAFIVALIEMFVSKNSKKDFAEIKK